MIIRKKDMVAESHEYTCSNPSCGRVFANPIKARNLALEKGKPYDACPYCLSEIVLEEPSAFVEEKEGLESKEIKSRRLDVHPVEEKKALPPEKIQGCEHFFGYLSKRASKEKIPEECIVCQNIVKCMLREVTG